MDPWGFPDLEQALSNKISIGGILEWTQKKVEVEESTRNQFSFWFWIKCIMPSTVPVYNIFDHYDYTKSFISAFNANGWCIMIIASWPLIPLRHLCIPTEVLETVVDSGPSSFCQVRILCKTLPDRHLHLQKIIARRRTYLQRNHQPKGNLNNVKIF